MNPRYILAGALFVLPLCGPIIIEPLIAVHDLWTAKEFLAMMFILALIVQHRATPCSIVQCRKNPFLIALLLFLPLSTYAAPPLALIYGHENLANLWIWRALAWCFAYYLLYQAIMANPPTCERHKKDIARAIGWAAIVNAGYAYLQALGFDQWQITRPYAEIGHTAIPHITGMIGNPTYLSIFLVISLPFVIFFFRWYWVAFVAGAVILTKSDFALASLVLMPVLLVCMRARSTFWIKSLIGLGMAGCVLLVANWTQIRPYVAQRANGRLTVWEQVLEDWRSPCIKLAVTEDMTAAQKTEVELLNKRTYTFTGRGLGSFPFIFSPKYSTRFESAHNEYLETLYSLGLIGLGLLLAAMSFVFYSAFQAARSDTFCLALYASFFFVCFAAFGLPIWHLEPLRFYSATVFSLLSCEAIRRRK